MKTFRVSVRGLVQGVGFRAFVVRSAAENGIRGGVRNSEDGSVEIDAQGCAPDLERFLMDVRQGPRMARVDDMRVETVDSPSVYRSFDIRW